MIKIFYKLNNKDNLIIFIIIKNIILINNFLCDNMSKEEDMEIYLKKTLLKSCNDSNMDFNNKYKKGGSIKGNLNNQTSSLSNYYETLKKDLLLKYEDKKFEDFPTVKTINTSYGETLEIINTEKIDFKIKENNIKEILKCDLKLLDGIGPHKENILKTQGYNNIDQLENHPIYSKSAKKINEKIESANFYSLFEYLKILNKQGLKYNTMMAASEIEVENLKFMDIETMGLSNVPIILIGVSTIKKNKIITKQFLQRCGKEEPAIIEAYLSTLDSDSVHVSYNGARFDIPFIRNRADYFNIKYSKHLNYDLLYNSRYLYRNKLKNCKLQSVESYICKFERLNDVPGQYIPGYYKTYVETGNIGPLIPIIKHNQLDITSLARIFLQIYEEINDKLN